MQISMGIVGLPNVGKSTLFNALTNKSVGAENYPFCTIDPSVGIVPVPDSRLYKLAEMSDSENVIPAVIEFVDIAGLVEGASKGEGLGNTFLANIREVDAIAHMVRIFEDDDITHVHGGVNPLHDIEVINLELILADLETVKKRREKLEKDLKRQDKEALFLDEVLGRAENILANEELISSHEWGEEEWEVIKGVHLLTAKKMLYVLNTKADSENLHTTKGEKWEKLMSFFETTSAEFVIVDAGLEGEIRGMDEDEKKLFRVEAGVEEDGGVNHLIVSSYDLLGLITFFTTGEKETRAWTTFRGATAPEAGASIHSDFQDNFIRAEIIPWDTLLEAGSRASAREKGLLRLEGKEYIVKDGDVVEFKI